jgi:hypothetical protein
MKQWRQLQGVGFLTLSVSLLRSAFQEEAIGRRIVLSAIPPFSETLALVLFGFLVVAGLYLLLDGELTRFRGRTASGEWGTTLSMCFVWLTFLLCSESYSPLAKGYYPPFNEETLGFCAGCLLFLAVVYFSFGEFQRWRITGQRRGVGTTDREMRK